MHLGIAVSLGEDGLIVPVVHDAQDLSDEGLARGSPTSPPARGRGLTPDDVRGGTFTITNPGAFGAIAATPIINQPQVGILDLEAVVKRPWSSPTSAAPTRSRSARWPTSACPGTTARSTAPTRRGSSPRCATRIEAV